MSYGCHPATGGACDCDWETDATGHDHFVQCQECAGLWMNDPMARWMDYVTAGEQEREQEGGEGHDEYADGDEDEDGEQGHVQEQGQGMYIMPH
jgi:hypothetical protein